MKTHSALMFLLLLAAIAPFSNAGDNPNVQRVRDYWQRVWSEGNLQAVAEFYHPACEQGDNFTIEGFQRNVTRHRESLPDFAVEVHEVFAHDNWVATRVTYRGTHTGRKMFGQEAMNKPIEVPGLDIFIFKDGKCVEHLHVADHLELVLQIGLKLTPAPPTEGTSASGS